MLMKSMLFTSVACGLAIVSFVSLGCGKNEKKDEGVVSKVAGYVGDEIKAKFTGRVDEIAGWYLRYDHEGLERAVSNPKSSESQMISKKVSSRMEYLENEWIKKSNLKEFMEIVFPFDEKTAIAIKMKMDYDKMNGNDVSKNFIPLNHRKWFAMQLSEELRKAVVLTCYDIKNGKPQDIIDRDWENVIEARERVTNYIDNKPVIYKQKKNASTTSDTSSTNNNTTPPNNNVTVQPFSASAISSATQSSFDNEDGYHHNAAKAIDGDIKSCWAEGVKGLGIGEYIQINFNGTYRVSGLNIWPGHQKSQDLFYKNARPVAIRIIGSDGSNEVYGLNDSMGMQRVNFRNPINVNNIKIVVDKVARGNKYEDTCIGEVSFF